MPTSSQAMILLKAELGTTCGSTSLSYSSMPTHSIRQNTMPFPVSSINLNEFFELCDNQVPSIYVTKPSQIQFERQHICTVHGSSSVFDGDKKRVTGTCSSQLCYDCGSQSFQEEETDAESEPPSHNGYHHSDTTITTRRALTADVKEITRNQQKRLEEYERLINLGYGYFDKKYHEKSRDKLFSNKRTAAEQIEKKHICGLSKSTELHRNMEIPPGSLTFSQMHVIRPTDNETTCRFLLLRACLLQQEGKKEEKEWKEVGVIYLPNASKTDFPQESTIKPSSHMRKDKPQSRPLSAIFGLRDNENTNHSEVSSWIENEAKVKVKELQYDPLSVRFSKPEAKSRWIVTFYNQEDLEKVVKKGIVHEDDRILFYKFDKIINRELNTYIFFKSIQDEKRRCRINSSHGARRKKSKVKGKTKRKSRICIAP
ncbi:hypothetical protein ACJMK2_029057 [Sinanodonta woodiana]|uniref:Uncharacterized protein n=1 Tax=Sinanodonta woodiana TaxID=1069815 RepID=A0ABD3XAZ4_SINWO